MKNNILYYNILILFVIANVVNAETGWIRQTEASFCMDECSMFYLEDESSNFTSNISFGEIDPELYINRFVEIEGNEIFCVECSAIEISQINISSECDYPFNCFVDPCEVAPDCELNTPVDCNANYCGGCYADFYDMEGNLVDCYIEQEPEPCDDINGIFFGICDMFMGYAVVNGNCEGVSGCGWEVDGINYINAFFDTIQECEQNCYNEPYLCEDIEYDYEQLFSGEYAQCEYNNDCVAVWGDCDVGLGGCHYSINPIFFDSLAVDDLSSLWITNDCMEWVCDCASLPNSVCNDGNCDLAYCYGTNPAGCDIAGCPDGYQCVDDPNSCIPSQCFCDEFYGDWYCTEDCGGGSCTPILNGDVNNDGMLNVVDVIMIVNMILEISEVDLIADMNGDNYVDIIDIVTIVNIILNN